VIVLEPTTAQRKEEMVRNQGDAQGIPSYSGTVDKGEKKVLEGEGKKSRT